MIPEVVGMFQKEVAERICSATGKKLMEYKVYYFNLVMIANICLQ